MSDLAKRLRIKAGMIEMGERIAWGSDSALMREAADALDHAAVERKKVGRPQIRDAFLRNGAHIEPGHDDLPDYVYEAAFELLEMAAPAVQGEPVGEVRFELGAPSYVYGEICSDAAPRLAPGTKLYTAPQPAPDVARLVEALTELCDEIDNHDIHSAISKTNILWFKRKARAALAPYRKGGEA